MHPRNAERKCVYDDEYMRIRWCEYIYSVKWKCVFDKTKMRAWKQKCVSMVKRKYKYDESAHTAGGVFVVYFVGIYGLFGE